MLFERICPPALLYLVFSITQIAIDSMKGLYNTALIKCWVTIVFTIILNYLCQSGLGIISWIIVFIPFILMTVIVSMLLVMFGLDPTTGKLAIAYDKNVPKKLDARAIARRNRRGRKKRHRLDRFTSEEYAKWRKYNESKQINTGYDESNISPQQQEVLNDAVSTRAGLSCDPLHSNCPKK